MIEKPIFYVSSEVLHIVRKNGQYSSEASEACGVLVGSTSIDKGSVWIEMATEPMDGDQRTLTSFRLRDNRHQERVESAFIRSKGTRCFLGTWHTHPETVPTPSSKDRKGWDKCRKVNKQIPFLAFIIGGTEEIRLFSKIKKVFVNVPFEEFSKKSI